MAVAPARGLLVDCDLRLATALKVWLVSAQTLIALAPMPADDELFVSTAVSILRGEWLGQFSSFTLVKGPGYSLWLALNQLIGVRLLVSQAVLYAIACAVLARALRPAIPARSRRALLFLALLFNPATWADGPATRVIREGIYSSLTLLVLGLAIGAALRLKDAPRRATLWAASAGVTGALFALTREEGIWLAPSLAVIVAVGLLGAWRVGWRRLIVPAVTAALAYAIPLTAVAAMNLAKYGVFQLGETRAAYYKSAYRALTRVETERWNPYVPVPREARAKIFEVSPAYREIAPYLEEHAPGWTVHGCKLLKVCDDIAGGWFMWAFRDALERADKYADASSARAWYERLTREIDDACESGRLRCRPSGLMASLPVFRATYLEPLASALLRAARFIATFDGVTPYPGTTPYPGPRASDQMDIAWFERVTHESVPPAFIQMHGVVKSRLGEITASVVDPRVRAAQASIERTSLASAGRSSDAGASFTRFSVKTTCMVGCLLVLRTRDGHALAVPIEAETGASDDENLAWTTEEFLSGAVPTTDQDARTGRLVVLAAVTRAYAVGTPVLLLAAVALLVWRLVRAARSRASPVLLLIPLSLLLAVSVRLLMLGILDVSTFPAINVTYCAPAYGVLVAFVAVVLVSSRPDAFDDRPAPPASRGDP